MPTYEYFCELNGQTVEVIHPMHQELNTWGEVCELNGQDCGSTPTQTPVIRQLSAIAALVPKGGRGPRGESGGGCCGGGCGCGGH